MVWLRKTKVGHVCKIINILMRITVFKDHILVNVSKVASMTHTGGAYNRTHDDCRRVTGHLTNIWTTVRRETLEGSNIGEFGEKPSIRQFLNHQCFL